MANFSKITLSGSAQGLPIVIDTTVSPGTLLHTAINSTSAIDEVYLWAANVTGSAATLTVEWGISGTGFNLIAGYSLAANSLPVLIASGFSINNGLIIRAFSGTANAINMVGYVNRIQ